jgi:branched-chain amino acid transport system substrate-binding protein
MELDDHGRKLPGPVVRYRRGAIVAAVAATGLVLAACGSSGGSPSSGDTQGNSGNSSAANKTVTLPVILPLTGAQAVVGAPIRDSLDALAKEVNKEGLLKGATLELKFLDNQSSASVAVSVASPLMKSTNYLMNGAVHVTEVPVNNLVTKDGPVVYNMSPAIEPDPNSFLLVSSATTTDVAKVAVKYADSQGWHRLALVTSTDPSGMDGHVSVQDAVKGSGVDIVTDQTFGIDDSSVSSQIAKVASAKPDVIVIWTTGVQIGTVFQGLREKGLQDVPVIMSYGNLYFQTMDKIASVLPNKLYSTAPSYMMTNSTLPAAQQQRVDMLYDALGKKPGTLDSTHSYSDDGLLLYVDALNNLGLDASASQIRDWIQSQTDWPGVAGIYHFSTDNHRGIDGDSYGIVQYDKETKLFKPVSPLGG